MTAADLDRATAPAPPKRVGKLLLVDDNRLLRETFAAGLERNGHSVDQAADGREGLRAAQATRFDVVITDLVMPDREGIELIAELRRQGLARRIVAISGADSADCYLAAAGALGADLALRKPFGLKELMSAVEGLLARA